MKEDDNMATAEDQLTPSWSQQPTSPSLLHKPRSPTSGSSDLETQLHDALRMLREKEECLVRKEKDLVMAAEMGTDLLDRYESLKADNEQLLAQCQLLAASAERQHQHSSDDPPPTPARAAQLSFSSPTQTTTGFVDPVEAKRRAAAVEAATGAQIASLEATVLDLQAQVDRAGLETRAAQESDRAAERARLRLEGELEGVTRDLDAAQSRCLELDADRKRLGKEKMDLQKRVKETADHDAQLECMSEQRERARALEDALVQLNHGRVEMEAELAAVGHDRDTVLRRCEELESMVEDFQSESEQHIARNDELSWDLESARDRIAKLEARLAVLEPQKDGQEDAGDRTLFSEVEDRRQELETRHTILSHRHAGLIKQHSQTVHQQERMRNHISRLTQLSHAREGELRVRLLEEALGQSESERSEMQARIALLEKHRGTGDFGTSGEVRPSSTSPLPSSDRESHEVELECLRLRVDQLSTEQTATTRELQTLRMVKSYETEKLRGVESLLREREEELMRLKHLNAQIKYDLDEAKARARREREARRATPQSVDDPNVSVEDTVHLPRVTYAATGVQTEIVELPTPTEGVAPVRDKRPPRRASGGSETRDRDNKENVPNTIVPTGTKAKRFSQGQLDQTISTDSDKTLAVPVDRPPLPLSPSKQPSEQPPLQRKSLSTVGKGGPTQGPVSRKPVQPSECKQQ